MNGIATGVMLLGMVFVVLGGSSFSIDPFFLCLHGGQSLYITKTMWVGFLFIIIGLSIKLGVAPFQWWLPPVYEGLSGMTLALVGVVAKVAQVGILVKLALITNQCSWISNFFAAAGLVSVLIGGLGILHSFLIRHQVAFLSIYSSGILYLFFAYLDKYTLDLLIFYFLTSNLLLFSYIFLIGLVAQSYSQLKTLWDFKTLIHAFPGLPFFFVIVLIGMLGLPPLVGFLPKYLFLHTLSLHLQYFYIIIFLFSTALVIFVVVDLFKEMFFQLPGSSEVWSVVRLRNRQLGLWNSLLLSVIVVLVFYLAIILSGMFLVGGF